MERAARNTEALVRLTPFAVPEASAFDVGARQGRNFAAERAEPNANVFEALTAHVVALQAAGKRVTIALWSEGARERMSHVLADHKLHNLDTGGRLVPGAGYAQADRRAGCAWASNPASRPMTSRSSVSRTSSAIASCGHVVPLAEPRISSPKPPVSRPAIWWCMWTTVSGVSRDCRPIEAAGAPHDCLEIHYAEGAKLYLPVENVDLLSRYGVGGDEGRSRSSWRRQLAGAQGAHEEPHPRDCGRIDQDCGRTAVARGAAPGRWTGCL